MSAGRFDYTGQYAAQKGGVFLIRIECVDASDAPVAITGTVEFTLWRTKNAGVPLLEKDLTVAANAAEVMLSEAELDAIAVGEYAYRIRQVSSAASLLIGGIFAVLPPGTGVVHLNSAPVRVVIGATVVRVLVAAPGAAGVPGDEGPPGTTDYNALSNKPTLGSAAALDVPASGNATSGQVVKGNDTRLSGGVAISGTPTSGSLGEWTDATTQKASGLSVYSNAFVTNALAFSSSANGGYAADTTAYTGSFGSGAGDGVSFGTKDYSTPFVNIGANGRRHINVRDDGFIGFGTYPDLCIERIGFVVKDSYWISNTICAVNSSFDSPSAHFAALTLLTENFTLAALISATPSPTLFQSAGITDATTATWVGGAPAVGGGIYPAKVHWNGSNWAYG